MKLGNLLLLGTLLSFSVCRAAGPDEDAPQAVKVKLQLVTDKILSPVGLAVPGDGSNRQFIVQKEGKVWVIQNGQLLPTPFIDVSNKLVKINPAYDERGLLGMAFHPQFKSNGKFYLYYSAPVPNPGKNLNHKSVVAEFKVNKASDNTASPATEKVVMEFDQPESNHNGGDLHFGADGYLYIATGDGGGGGDKHGTIGNGQDLGTEIGRAHV